MVYENDEQIKDELNRILKVRNVSKKELADRLDMSPQNLNCILNKKNINFEDVKKLLDAIHCELVFKIRIKDHPYNAIEDGVQGEELETAIELLKIINKHKKNT